MYKATYLLSDSYDLQYKTNLKLNVSPNKALLVFKELNIQGKKKKTESRMLNEVGNIITVLNILVRKS